MAWPMARLAERAIKQARLPGLTQDFVWELKSAEFSMSPTMRWSVTKRRAFFQSGQRNSKAAKRRKAGHLKPATARTDGGMISHSDLSQGLGLLG